MPVSRRDPRSRAVPYPPAEQTPWVPLAFRDTGPSFAPLDLRAQMAASPPLTQMPPGWRNPPRQATSESNPFRQVLAQKVGPESNPFRAVLEQKVGSDAPKSDVSANFVGIDRGSRTFLNNLGAIPDTSGELIANTINAGRAAVGQAARVGANNFRSMTGLPRKPNPSFGERYDLATENEGFPQAMLRGIPRPTFEGAQAAALSIPALMPGGESFGQAYDRNLAADASQQEQMRSAHPVAATVGDIGGDVASLLLGRRASGASGMMQRVETRLAGRTAGAAKTLADDLDKIMRSPAMRALARGGARSIETGVEAAALDILKDPNADPTETAALAAGGQLVGSGFLGASQGLLTGGGVKGAALSLTVAAATTMGLVQMLKSATPGGRDRVLDSIETGYDKVLLTLAIGAGFAAIGATRYGRGNINFSDQTRTFLDAIGTTHRGATLSVLTDWAEGDDAQKARIENVLTQIAKDPNYKGESLEDQRLVLNLREGPKYKTGGNF